MPWLETSPVEQRERFIRDHRLELYAMAELCARYGISRKTAYKWLARFDEEGRRGLANRSRAPHRCPHPGPARHQHRRGPLGSPRAREEAAAPAPLPASGRCPADHGAAQRWLLLTRVGS